jgi:hypothetical protein
MRQAFFNTIKALNVLNKALKALYGAFNILKKDPEGLYKAVNLLKTAFKILYKALNILKKDPEGLYKAVDLLKMAFKFLYKALNIFYKVLDIMKKALQITYIPLSKKIIRNWISQSFNKTREFDSYRIFDLGIFVSFFAEAITLSLYENQRIQKSIYPGVKANL